MTRAEAESELAALEVREAAAWQECKSIDAEQHDALLKLEQQRVSIMEQFASKKTAARNLWIPLQRRKYQLQAFLE